MNAGSAARPRPPRRSRGKSKAAPVTPPVPPPRRVPSASKPMLPLLVSRSELPINGSRKVLSPAAGGVVVADRGIMGLNERGALAPDFDLEPVLTSDGPMRSVKAPLHAGTAAERRRRQPVMTEVSGFKQMNEYHLDFSEIEKIPTKLNVGELRKWEVEEAAAAAAAGKSYATHTDTSSTLSHSEAESTAPPGDGTVGSGPSRDDPRTYAELLDLYSMHEFIIRKGKTLRTTPEFVSFKRHYAPAWGNIETVIEALEKLLGSHGIDLAYIDGKKLAALASFQLGAAATSADLVDCVANADEIGPLLADATYQYRHGDAGLHLAAAKIQSVWRMYRQGIAYRHLLLGTRAATVIQHQWIIHRAHCSTRRTIQAVRQARVARWRQTMAKFTKKWPEIQRGRRTIIHIPSLSYPAFHAKKVPYYAAQQLGQLTRLCDLADPKADVVIVVPWKPEPEVLTYYHSLLEEAGIENVKGRLTLLAPEEAKRLPEGMSLTRLVLFSARLMKMLRAMCAGKPAYIVPGVIGPEELLLASQLNVPLLSPEPHIAQVFSTKTGCHRLLEAADVPTPVGAWQLRTRADLLRALASLMLTHKEYPRWLVKLETEAGSRGHAYFDVSRMKTLQAAALGQLQAEAAAVLPAAPPGPAETDVTASPVFDALLRELEAYGAKRVRLVHQADYADWGVYLDMVDAVGACVEAVPVRTVGSVTANLFVEPTGEVHLHSIVEPLLAPAFTVIGSCCPPTFPYPEKAVAEAALRLARAAYRKRVFGYLSVDMILYTNKPGATPPVDSKKAGASRSGTPARGEDGEVQLWGVDVDLWWNNNAVAHHLAAMISRPPWTAFAGPSSLDHPAMAMASPLSPRGSVSRSGSVSIVSAGGAGSPVADRPEVRYVYTGIVYNPFISGIRHTPFFSLCRSRGITYDCERRVGVIFHLMDVLLCGCVGALCVGPDMKRNIRKISDFQSVLNLELPKQGEHSAGSNFTYFSAAIRQLARHISGKTS